MDLTGVGGRLQKVTVEELRKHNSQDDCWMAINGNRIGFNYYTARCINAIVERLRGKGVKHWAHNR